MKIEFPAMSGSLLVIDPIEVQPSLAFAEAKKAIANAIAETEGLRKHIGSERDHDEATRLIAALKRFRSLILERSVASREEIAKAGEEQERRVHELLDPMSELIAGLSAEAQRYQAQRERDQQQADLLTQQKSDSHRKAAEHNEGILVLRAEIATARQVADNADRVGEQQTAREIRKALQRFQALDSAPQSFTDPRKAAREVRLALAEALHNECSNGRFLDNAKESASRKGIR